MKKVLSLVVFAISGIWMASCAGTGDKEKDSEEASGKQKSEMAALEQQSADSLVAARKAEKDSITRVEQPRLDSIAQDSTVIANLKPSTFIQRGEYAMEFKGNFEDDALAKILVKNGFKLQSSKTVNGYDPDGGMVDIKVRTYTNRSLKVELSTTNYFETYETGWIEVFFPTLKDANNFIVEAKRMGYKSDGDGIYTDGRGVLTIVQENSKIFIGYIS